MAPMRNKALSEFSRLISTNFFYGRSFGVVYAGQQYAIKQHRILAHIYAATYNNLLLH